jgi:hypothetical protein
VLAFGEALEASRANVRIVAEDISSAAVARDETEAFRIVEPLDDP